MLADGATHASIIACVQRRRAASRVREVDCGLNETAGLVAARLPAYAPSVVVAHVFDLVSVLLLLCSSCVVLAFSELWRMGVGERQTSFEAWTSWAALFVHESEPAPPPDAFAFLNDWDERGVDGLLDRLVNTFTAAAEDPLHLITLSCVTTLPLGLLVFQAYLITQSRSLGLALMGKVLASSDDSGDAAGCVRAAVRFACVIAPPFYAATIPSPLLASVAFLVAAIPMSGTRTVVDFLLGCTVVEWTPTPRQIRATPTADHAYGHVSQVVHHSPYKPVKDVAFIAAFAIATAVIVLRCSSPHAGAVRLVVPILNIAVEQFAEDMWSERQQVAIVSALGVGLCCVFYMLFRFVGKLFVWTIVLSSVVWYASLVYANFAIGLNESACWQLLWLVVTVRFIFSLRHQIALTIEVIKHACTAVTHVLHLVLFIAALQVVYTMYQIWFLKMLDGARIRGAGHHMFFLLGFHYYWTYFTFIGMITVATSGAVARWAYRDNEPPERRGIFRHAFAFLRQSLFASLGTAFAGGLLMAVVEVIKLVRQQCDRIRSNAPFPFSIPMTITSWGLQLVEYLVPEITRFSMVCAGVYGDSAKDGIGRAAGLVLRGRTALTTYHSGKVALVQCVVVACATLYLAPNFTDGSIIGVPQLVALVLVSWVSMLVRQFQSTLRPLAARVTLVFPLSRARCLERWSMHGVLAVHHCLRHCSSLRGAVNRQRQREVLPREPARSHDHRSTRGLVWVLQCSRAALRACFPLLCFPDNVYLLHPRRRVPCGVDRRGRGALGGRRHAVQTVDSRVCTVLAFGGTTWARSGYQYKHRVLLRTSLTQSAGGSRLALAGRVQQTPPCWLSQVPRDRGTSNALRGAKRLTRPDIRLDSTYSIVEGRRNDRDRCRSLRKPPLQHCTGVACAATEAGRSGQPL